MKQKEITKKFLERVKSAEESIENSDNLDYNHYMNGYIQGLIKMYDDVLYIMKWEEEKEDSE